MPILDLLPLATDTGAEVAPFLVGGGALLIFIFALFGILAFGKGREHS